MTDSGAYSYQQRNQSLNTAEILFEKYCNEKQYFIRRLGFDEKNDPVPDFFNLNPFIRNLPDYIINNNDTLSALVMVKGTANIKQKEYNLIPQMRGFYSSEKCPLVYCFCFRNTQPIFLHIKKVMDLYENSIDQQWHDGVIYRNLKLPNNK